MKKFSRNFRLPEDIVEILDQSGDSNRTDIVIEGIRFIDEMDYDTVKKMAKEVGLTPGRLVDVAIQNFSELPPKQQDEKIAQYFGILRRKAEKELNQ